MENNVLHLPQPPEDWVNQYVGIEFVDGGNSLAGADCWGLLEMVLTQQFKVALPAYDRPTYDDGKERQKISDYIVQMAEEYPWMEITVEEARSGDVLLIRMRGFKTHVAVVVSRGFMLHTEMGANSTLERYDGIIWKNRIVGTYRHAEIAHA